MQMLTLPVIFEFVAFHGEITCTTRIIYIMHRMHLGTISPICVHFVELSIWPIVRANFFPPVKIYTSESIDYVRYVGHTHRGHYNWCPRPLLKYILYLPA